MDVLRGKLARPAFASVITAMLLAPGACGGAATRAAELMARPVYLEADLPLLIERANAWTASSLRAEGQLRMYWSGDEDSRHVDARLFATQSGALVMYGSRTLAGKIFDLIADGLEFQLVVPDHAAHYMGTADVVVETDPERPYFSLRPHHMTESLLPEVLPVGSSPDSHVILETHPDRYVLTWMEAQGNSVRIRRKVWIERVALRVSRIEGFDANGRIDFVARYSGYPEGSWAGYPSVIEVERPWEELIFRFDLKSAERDPSIPPGAFRFQSLPPGYRTLTIEEAMAEFRRARGD